MNSHGMDAMRFLAIAGNCSCIAGIPAIPSVNPHGMDAMRSMAIAGNCSCIAGIPAIPGHSLQLLLRCRHTCRPWQ